MHVEFLVVSPIGKRASFHLSPLNSCAVIPNTIENIIIPQSISSMITWLTLEKSNSLYIHHSIPPPRQSENRTLNIFLIDFLSTFLVIVGI